MLVLASVTVAIWLSLTLFHGFFWLTRPLLDAAPASLDTELPPVLVLVPARNEEQVLAQTLPALTAQDYPGELRITLVDDSSTDGTAAIAAAFPAVTVLPGAPTPAGWAGKVWALQQGLSRVLEAGATPNEPEFVLFTDADIWHPPDSVRRLVATAVRRKAGTVSLMARLRCESTAEHWLIPAFVYFFAQLYPFRWVSSPRRRTTAAAGGCLLVRIEALPRNGLEDMRGALIDDVATARLVRRGGGSTWLGYTSEVLSLRDYPKLSDIWSMVTRSAWVQLRHSWLLLVGTIAGLFLSYVAPVVCSIDGTGPARWLGLAAWASMTLTFVPVSRLYGRPLLSGVALPAIAAAYAAMTLDSARRGGADWKDRPPPARAR